MQQELLEHGYVEGQNLTFEYRYIDGIFNGARADELPIQQPNRLELVMNLRVAKALGLDIPPRLLAIADEVIE